MRVEIDYGYPSFDGPKDEHSKTFENEAEALEFVARIINNKRPGEAFIKQIRIERKKPANGEIRKLVAAVDDFAEVLQQNQFVLLSEKTLAVKPELKQQGRKTILTFTIPRDGEEYQFELTGKVKRDGRTVWDYRSLSRLN